jgi:type 1 glutamine amidotransferase
MQTNPLSLLMVLCVTLGYTGLPAGTTNESLRALIVVGPTDHPPGTHEVAAGGRLVKHCLEHAANLPGIRADVVYGWPADPDLREAADTLVFIGDTFPPQRLPNTTNILAQLKGMMDRGCGIVCIHYATGLEANDVGSDGEHPLLGWIGGYFATRCPHHQSVARIFPTATIHPASPGHPISRGWREFTLHDEPYINNYFGPQDNHPASNVTAIATSLLPPESSRREVVAWAVERGDGGRGFAVVMPHFYRNWSIDDLRRLILNGIVWSAGRDVPPGGVQTSAPNLAAFGPEAIDPPPVTR